MDPAETIEHVDIDEELNLLLEQAVVSSSGSGAQDLPASQEEDTVEAAYEALAAVLRESECVSEPIRIEYADSTSHVEQNNVPVEIVNENSLGHWAAIVRQEGTDIPIMKQDFQTAPVQHFTVSELTLPERPITIDQHERTGAITVETFKPELLETGDVSQSNQASDVLARPIAIMATNNACRNDDHTFARPYPTSVRESIERGRRTGRITPASLRFLHYHRMALRRPHPAIQLMDYLCQCLRNDRNRGEGN